MSRGATMLVLSCCVMNLAPAASTCNLTLSEHTRVSVPELAPPLEGSPLTCVIRVRTPPHLDGQVIRLAFTRLRVGAFRGRRCMGGAHLIIRDGGATVGSGNSSRFCGESDQPHEYLAENDYVEVEFYSERFDSSLDFVFEVSWLDKLAERFGPRPDLALRGHLVTNTFCERVFNEECSKIQQTCLVQSPGFPGVYPRGLRCRYYISARRPHIKLYLPPTSSSVFDVGGRDCDSVLECPFRPISSNCDGGDRVSVYDGVDEFSRLIGTFCGTGTDFPSAIVGTGKDLFLEFVTAEEGPFLGRGFDLRVGHLPGTLQSYYTEQGKCRQTFTSESVKDDNEGLFLSLEHWYPPNTTCTFVIQGSPNEIVRLYFPSFKIGRIENPVDPSAPGDCRESLTLLDGPRVIRSFCDGFSRPLERGHDFVSTTPTLTVEFISTTGSYSGSSLHYWAQYDFFDNSVDGERVEGTICDERFVGKTRATFRSLRNTLVFKDPKHNVRCNYDIDADSDRSFGRVKLTLKEAGLHGSDSGGGTCEKNDDDMADLLKVFDPASPENKLCLTANDGGEKIFFSRGPRLRLSLFVNRLTATRYFKTQSPLFVAAYELMHPPRLCGPAAISDSLRGVLTFPYYGGDNESDYDVSCAWDIAVSGRRTVSFNLSNFTFNGECEAARLDVVLPTTNDVVYTKCADTDKRVRKKIPALTPKRLSDARFVQVRLKVKEKGFFQFSWVEE